MHEGRQQREVRGRTGRAVSDVWQVRFIFKPVATLSCTQSGLLAKSHHKRNTVLHAYWQTWGGGNIYSKRMLSLEHFHSLLNKLLFFIVWFQQSMLPMCNYEYWQNAKQLCRVQHVVCSIILFDSSEYFKHPLDVSQTPRLSIKEQTRCAFFPFLTVVVPRHLNSRYDQSHIKYKFASSPNASCKA